jgi:hypothetical protein
MRQNDRSVKFSKRSTSARTADLIPADPNCAAAPQAGEKQKGNDER